MLLTRISGGKLAVWRIILQHKSYRLALGEMTMRDGINHSKAVVMNFSCLLVTTFHGPEDLFR